MQHVYAACVCSMCMLLEEHVYAACVCCMCMLLEERVYAAAPRGAINASLLLLARSPAHLLTCSFTDLLARLLARLLTCSLNDFSCLRDGSYHLARSLARLLTG